MLPERAMLQEQLELVGYDVREIQDLLGHKDVNNDDLCSCT